MGRITVACEIFVWRHFAIVIFGMDFKTDNVSRIVYGWRGVFVVCKQVLQLYIWAYQTHSYSYSSTQLATHNLFVDQVKWWTFFSNDNTIGFIQMYELNPTVNCKYLERDSYLYI